MRAFGAELEVIHAENGILAANVIDRMIARARDLASGPGTLWPDQVNNQDNLRGYHGMAGEIIVQLDIPIDEFVTVAGGGGCISGNAELLKAHNPATRIIAVEPDKVRNLSGADTNSTHKLEGIGLFFVPAILRRDLIDAVVPVTDDDA